MAEKVSYEELERRFKELQQAAFEIKEREEELREHREMLESIINGVSMLMAYIDREERYGFVNRAYADWYGVTREELLGKKVSDILSPDAYKMAAGNIKKALNGQGVFYTNKVIAKDGSERYVNANYDPHCIKNEVKGFFATIVDITEQKQSEASLRESEDKFKQLFDNSPIGKSITYVSGEMRTNSAFYQMLGYSQDELYIFRRVN